MAHERGTIRKQAPLQVSLVYPSPYPVAISSLGYQAIYRLINDRAGACCERAVLYAPSAAPPLRTLEAGRPVGDAQVVALSVATEAEVALAAQALTLAGLEPLEERRRAETSSPLVVAGGPLTYGDGTPLAALADVVLCGEAEDSLSSLLDLLDRGIDRMDVLTSAAELPGALVPALAPTRRIEPVRCSRSWLPAAAAVVTPFAELGDMFLVEPVRGCPHRCTFCVMAGRKLRVVPAEKVLTTIPDHARRVGLVGSAIGHHPELRDLLAAIVDRGLEVSLSSLRADRLDDELVKLLVRGGARSLTVAADGASQRLRDLVDKRITDQDLLSAARLAADHGLRSLKLYAMVGLPSEADEDILELCRLALEMAAMVPVSLAVSPFVPKAGTPLAEASFAPVSTLRARLALIRKAVKGRVEIRSSSIRQAWVEQAVARGGLAAGRAAVEAARLGGGHAAWRQALADHEHRSPSVR